MSSPTIRISDSVSFPEISTIHDEGRSLDINQNDFDLNLLGNQRKIAGSMGGGGMGGSGGGRSSSPGMDLKQVDDIEFVSLDEQNVTFDVRTNGTANDNIRITRDSAPPPVSAPTERTTPRTDAPFQLGSGSVSSAPTLSLGGGGGGFGNTTTTIASAPAAQPKSWFSSLVGGGAPAPAPAAAAPATGTAAAGGFRSWFSGGGGTSAPAPAPEPAYLSPEEEVGKKTEGLTILERMDRKGISGTKMSMSNTLDEINTEVARRKDSKGLEASLRFQRSMITTVTSGMEFLNSRYDPFGVALDGWSEQVNENIEDYDEIFEELYDKYKDKSKVAPEVRLILSLGLSAGMCHVTNTMFKSRMPGMDDILRKNPELARQFARAAAQESVGPGFANFMSMGSKMPAQGPPPSMSSMRPPPPQPPVPEEFENSFEPAGGSFGSQGGPAGMSPPLGGGAPFMGEVEGMTPPPTIKIRRELRGPSGVEDILQQLEANRAVPQQRGVERNDMEESASIGSGYTTETMRRNGVNRRGVRRTTTQPTGETLTLNV